MPSRGLVFSRTMETVIQNLQSTGVEYELFMAHDLPLPECFNEPIERALKSNVDVIWFVEEDMVIYPGILSKMLKEYQKGYKVISGEYADRRTGITLVARNEKGVVLYSGMGCLLVDASLFSKLDKPYIRRYCFQLIKTKHGKDYKPLPEVMPKWYGTQDVWFSYRLRKLGNEIKVIEGKIGHLQLVARGKDEKNAGAHTIVEVNLKSAEQPKLFDTIGFDVYYVSKMLVKVNHTGSCMDHFYTKGVAVDLPEEVIGAIGKENVQIVEVVKSKKVEPKKGETKTAKTKEMIAPKKTVMEKTQVETK